MRTREHGYAMAALLVALTVMAIMMTAAMPVWQQISQREKEEELVFRGQQYARAVGLYGRKYANAPPPSIDVLVQQRFLRKKYKDPVTNDDFVPITAAQAAAASAQPGTAGRAGGPGPAAAPATRVQGGISGVTSKSKATSIRVYNGRTHYNEWAFVYVPPAETPGAGGLPGTTTPGQRGQPQRGQQGPPGGPGGPGGPAGRGVGTPATSPFGVPPTRGR
ncbi:MAG: type II secretion system protein [Vicinamibacterales bacterium]